MFRTRFAPSPTGHLHVGGARTAVLNWLLARHFGGEFVLRVEDTDVERNLAGAEEEILADLRWLGLEWDEGPDVGGALGPYRQSERMERYHEHADRLLASGAAYPCTCPPRSEASGHGHERCACAARPAGLPLPAGASVRLRVPDDEEFRVDDLVRGEIVFPPGSIEDFVLLRSDGRPTYNFAAAVDDAAMRITLVLRGADHIANTPKQQLVYRAFGWEPPRFAHIPLILGPDRQKLSKRHGATSVAEHRRIGYLPDALVNYLSLLSWSSPSGEEFLPPERLVEEIGLERVGIADAVFDREKLRWLSSRYIQALPVEELIERVTPFLDLERFPIDPLRLPTALAALRERISVLSEANDWLGFFVGPHTASQREARAAALADAASRPVLDAVREQLGRLAGWDETEIDAAVRAGGKAAGAKGKQLFLPLRLALTGEAHGPELPRIVYVLGRERAISLLSPTFSV
jgi:nondiscriminating glutamyl-tRNA synthetase